MMKRYVCESYSSLLVLDFIILSYNAYYTLEQQNSEKICV